MKIIISLHIVLLFICYVSSVDPQSDLSRAYEAAFTRASNSGYVESYILPEIGPQAQFPATCVNSSISPFPPHPAASSTSSLAKIIFSKTVKLGYLWNSTNPGVQIVNSKPQGPHVIFQEKLWQIVGQNYGVNITIQWRLANSEDELFSLLERNLVDAVPMDFELGALYRGMPRIWAFLPSTCYTERRPYKLFVRNDSKYTLMSELERDFISGKASILTYGESSGRIGQIVLGRMPTIFLSPLAAVDAVQKGNFDAAWLLDIPTAAVGLARPLQIDVPTAVVFYTTFFAKENCSVANDTTPLRKAYERVMSELILSANANLTKFLRLIPSDLSLGCLPTPWAYRIPEPTGLLANILADGKVKTTFISGISNRVIDTTVFPPQGPLFDLLETIVGRIGGLYGRKVIVEYEPYVGTPSEQFYLLNSSVIDIAPLLFALGVEYRGVSRDYPFQPSHCHAATFLLRFQVLRNSSYNSSSQLLSASIPAGKAICTEREDSQFLAQSLFQTPFQLIRNHTLAVQSLNNGNCIALFAPVDPLLANTRLISDSKLAEVDSSWLLRKPCV